MIDFFNVTKKYPSGPVALANLSFQIDRGEFVFLTGPSGAGKTTLLKLVYREEVPDEGQILVNGRNVGSLPRRKVPYLRRSVGVVFQSFRLIRRKTVFENVSYLPRILGHSEQEQRRVSREALAKVGLAHRLDAFPSGLSGGEQQRVTLARALVCRPEILVADEPTGNLDSDLSDEIIRLFLEIHTQGTTVLLATHDRRILEHIGGRVLSLERGRLVGDGELTARRRQPPSPRRSVPLVSGKSGSRE